MQDTVFELNYEEPDWVENVVRVASSATQKVETYHTQLCYNAKQIDNPKEKPLKSLQDHVKKCEKCKHIENSGFE